MSMGRTLVTRALRATIQLACASSGCHTGAQKADRSTRSQGGVTATFSGGLTYTPGGAPITITVTVTDPDQHHYGFQMTARLGERPQQRASGRLRAGGPNQIVLCDDNTVKGANGCPAASSLVQFIEHDYPSDTHVGTTPYMFTWTPPATNVGNVIFYVAGNSVNNNLQADAGDHVYTNYYVLTPCPAVHLHQHDNAGDHVDRFGERLWRLFVFRVGHMAGDQGHQPRGPGRSAHVGGHKSWPVDRGDFTGSNAPTISMASA